MLNNGPVITTLPRLYVEDDYGNFFMISIDYSTLYKKILWENPPMSGGALELLFTKV